MTRRSRTFSQRVLRSQLVVIVVILAVVTGAFAWLGARTITDISETKALSTARALASTDVVRRASTEASATHRVDPKAAESSDLQRFAMEVQRREGVQFVVVTDDRGIRLAHPTAAELGKKVSTPPDVALGGGEEITHDSGTLGETVRAKVPVYSTSDDGAVVGEVSVGIHTSVLDADLHRELAAVGAIAVVALALGTVASVYLGRRLQRLTLGVGPEELAEMARHQEAVLHGLDDGVLGFSPKGRLTLANRAARDLLGEPGEGTRHGRNRGDLPAVPGGIREMVDELFAGGGDGPIRRRITVGERFLLATAVGVRRNRVSVGGVVTLRDETQMLTMSRQLESVTAMAQALRAQRHEFANRLHTVMGLVGTGETDEAHRYIGQILQTGPIAAPVEGFELVSDPYLRALLEAKGTTGAEAGVTLRVSADSLVVGRVRSPEDVTLILGNLVDNAVRAVVEARPVAAVVEVQLLSAGSELHGVVTDSGAGVSGDPERIFAEGVTSGGNEAGDAVHGHGIGLPLCRRVARRHGGEVWLIAAHDPDLGGASFGMKIPDAVEED